MSTDRRGEYRCFLYGAALRQQCKCAMFDTESRRIEFVPELPLESQLTVLKTVGRIKEGLLLRSRNGYTDLLVRPHIFRNSPPSVCDPFHRKQKKLTSE